VSFVTHRIHSFHLRELPEKELGARTGTYPPRISLAYKSNCNPVGISVIIEEGMNILDPLEADILKWYPLGAKGLIAHSHPSIN